MKKEQKRNGAARRLTLAAIVAALYIAMSYIAAAIGLASGPVQIRLSEMLCIMPVFFPEAIAGLTIGCMLSNMLVGCALFDVIFGTLATFVGAVGAYLLRRLPKGAMWLAALPNFAVNTAVVPIILMKVYGVETGYGLLALGVGIGEAVSCVLLGSMLYYSIKKARLF